LALWTCSESNRVTRSFLTALPRVETLSRPGGCFGGEHSQARAKKNTQLPRLGLIFV
jgi:hypothetical protein